MGLTKKTDGTYEFSSDRPKRKRTKGESRWKQADMEKRAREKAEKKFAEEQYKILQKQELKKKRLEAKARAEHMKNVGHYDKGSEHGGSPDSQDHIRGHTILKTDSNAASTSAKGKKKSMSEEHRGKKGFR